MMGGGGVTSTRDSKFLPRTGSVFDLNNNEFEYRIIIIYQWPNSSPGILLRSSILPNMHPCDFNLYESFGL